MFFACMCGFQTSGTVVTKQLGIFRGAFLSRHHLFLYKFNHHFFLSDHFFSLRPVGCDVSMFHLPLTWVLLFNNFLRWLLFGISQLT